MEKINMYIGIGLIVLILGVVIYGLVGSSKAEEIGITCDFGLGKDGDVFCWNWHQNIIGDIGDALDEIANN